MTASRFPAIGIWAIILTAIASGLSLSYRYRIEAKNKRVGLCIEMQAVKEAAAAIMGAERLDSFPSSLQVVLKRLKQEGVQYIAISEDHLSDLFMSGDAKLESGILTATPGETYRRVRFGIEDRFRLQPPTNDRNAGVWGPINIPASILGTVSIGLDPADAKAVRNAGMDVIARLGNAPATDMQYVGQKLTDAQALGATVLLPEGDSVIGQRFLIEPTAGVLEEMNMLYAAPEFAKLSGDARMASVNLPRLIRLHSIQAAEIERMSPSEAIERWVRAFSERNIRFLLLRPLSSTAKTGEVEDNAVDNLLAVVKSVRDGVIREGGGVGVARPFEDPQSPLPLFFVVGLLSAIVAIIAATLIIKSQVLQACIAIALVTLGLACYFPQARPFMALIAAMTFPIAAYLYLGGTSKISPLKDYAVMTLISVTGGLAVAALLNSLPYMVRVEQFIGVKLAHFGPIIVIGLLVTSWSSSLMSILRENVRWIALFAGFICMGAVGLMLIRTGNDNPSAVSGIELRFRSLLDAVLLVRPRTKEFLLGNPALILGLLIWWQSSKSAGQKLPPNAWASVLLVIGAIGQTSIVNTLCHLHTPLHLSLLRIAMGWLSGGIVGLLLWLLFRPKPPRLVPTEA